MDVLTINQINQLYPDEWVVIGCTKCEGEETKEGVVLIHSSDIGDIYQFLTQRVPSLSSQFPLGIVIRYANAPIYPETDETSRYKEE